MLVLSRKPDESIVINANGELITIEIVQVKGKHVRLGITADESITVNRKEIQDRIDADKAEREAAA